MGRRFQDYLEGDSQKDGQAYYRCMQCSAHLARRSDLISKGFQGRAGRAYLFRTAVNVTVGPSEQRMLQTGLHKVSDIYCSRCHTLFGWKYDQAFRQSQKYKEGCVVIEVAYMMKDNMWGEKY